VKARHVWYDAAYIGSNVSGEPATSIFMILREYTLKQTMCYVSVDKLVVTHERPRPSQRGVEN
jgi:hypothetical protein